MTYTEEILLELHNKFYPHVFSLIKEYNEDDFAERFKLCIDGERTYISITPEYINDIHSSFFNPEEELSALIHESVEKFINDSKMEFSDKILIELKETYPDNVFKFTKLIDTGEVYLQLSVDDKLTKVKYNTSMIDDLRKFHAIDAEQEIILLMKEIVDEYLENE